MKKKLLNFYFCLVIAVCPMVSSAEVARSLDFYSVIENDEIRNQIKELAGNKTIIFFSIKNDYGFLSFSSEEESSYLTKELGNFHGKFRANYLLRINKILEQEGNNIQFNDEELEHINSVRDGLSVTISGARGQFTLSDPLALFLSKDDTFSPRLNRLVLSTLQIVFDLSKFDAIIYKYLHYSVDDFELGFSNFDEFLAQLEKQRVKYQQYNIEMNKEFND